MAKKFKSLVLVLGLMLLAGCDPCVELTSAVGSEWCAPPCEAAGFCGLEATCYLAVGACVRPCAWGCAEGERCERVELLAVCVPEAED